MSNGVSRRPRQKSGHVASGVMGGKIFQIWPARIRQFDPYGGKIFAENQRRARGQPHRVHIATTQTREDLDRKAQ
jgi:hypothetical protein